MIYKEEKRDLFSVPDDYYLAHCISADFKMGAGIAVEFNKRFDMKNILQTKHSDYIGMWHHYKFIGDCLEEGRVLNLITKERYYQKPTYASMESALIQMLYCCEELNIKKIAMPIIGCGLDKLEWDKVSELIKKVFDNTDIEILVCIKDIKNIPKKPIVRQHYDCTSVYYTWQCPTCNNEWLKEKPQKCAKCGQFIDWSKNDK